MDTAIRTCILIALQVLLVGTGQAELPWLTNMNEARIAAGRDSKNILLFFPDPGTPLTALHKDYLEKAEMELEISKTYKLAKIPYSANLDMAHRLHVFKAGTVVVYSSSGLPLTSIQHPTSYEEFRKLLSSPGSSPPADAIPTGENAAEPLLAASLPAATTGSAVLGSYPIPLTSAQYIQAGPLLKDQHYVLMVEGTGSIWAGQTDGIDGFYTYRRPAKPGEIKLTRLVRIGNDKKPLYDAVKSWGSQPPPYNPRHIYEVTVPGSGEFLKIGIQDGDARSLADNSGTLRFTVYEVEKK